VCNWTVANQTAPVSPGVVEYQGNQTAAAANRTAENSTDAENQYYK
jgi:hypothetical protein